jgi:solute carrier family 9B (sodium/hydrogen exchanger), member 1/2
MATSLALIMLMGLLFSTFFIKLKLPGLLGMLILGILIGPDGLSLLHTDLLNNSGDLRKIALIIILLRAGFGINRETLKETGATALKLSFVPGLLEGFTIAFISIHLLGLSFIQGGILGFIIAAVSPAVIVPQMLDLNENRVGTNKGIPTLILTSASVDDVFAITIFTTFLGLYGGSQVKLGAQLFKIPLSIFLGIFLGFLLGLLAVYLFKKYPFRDTKKVLLILGTGILLTALENSLKNKIEIASLIGVMAIGFTIFDRIPVIGKRLALKFNKIWIFAELLLFVLVGATVNINVALNAGFQGILIIFIGLIARSIGVFISTIRTDLNQKERLFCAIAYIPKATVQAAVGSIPLSLGVS